MNMHKRQRPWDLGFVFVVVYDSEPRTVPGTWMEMDGWMDEQVDGWVDRQMDRWMDEWLSGRTGLKRSLWLLIQSDCLVLITGILPSCLPATAQPCVTLPDKNVLP